MSASEEFEVISRSEHRRILDLFDELEIAGERQETARIARVARELRGLAEPHFLYEQEALFPQLVGELGREKVEWLHSAQDHTVKALNQVEVLADRGPLDEHEVAEAMRLARSARTAVVSCDAICDGLDPQPAEVAKQILAARERVLAQT